LRDPTLRWAITVEINDDIVDREGNILTVTQTYHEIAVH